MVAKYAVFFIPISIGSDRIIIIIHAKQKLVDVIAQSKASELFMDSSSNENVVLFCMKNELFSGLIHC